MSFFSRISPARAIRDFRSVWTNDVPYKWLFLFAACLPPVIMTVTFALDLSEKSTPPPPGVLYIESWPLDRSMEQIMADRQERIEAMEEYERQKREDYKTLGRTFGMDVEAIEAEAEALKEDGEGGEAAPAPDDRNSSGSTSE